MTPLHHSTMNKSTQNNNMTMNNNNYTKSTSQMNNLIKSLNGLIESEDFEIVLIGETMKQHLGKYIREIMAHNLTEADAIAAMTTFCNHCLARLEAGEEANIPFYRDEIVAHIAHLCPDESFLCA